MASGIFVILDDVAALLDDAAVMSKVAAKKTAGLLGDDLAVNAEKATGFRASRAARRPPGESTPRSRSSPGSLADQH